MTGPAPEPLPVDVDRTARTIKGEQAVRTPTAEMRLGVITGFDVLAATVDVNLGGDTTTIPQVRYLAAYHPIVGETVVALVAGPDIWVLDKPGRYEQYTIDNKQTINFRAPIVAIRADHRRATFDGTVHRTVLIHTDTVGNDDGDSVVEHYVYSNGTALHAPGNNVGWFFSDSTNPDGISAQHNDLNPAHIYCSGITQSSGVDGKDNITDIPFAGLSVVRGARSRMWEVRHEGQRPTKPGHRVRRVTFDADGEPAGYEWVDAEWSDPSPRTARKRFGPLAEEVAAVAPQLAAQLPIPDGEPRPGLNLGDMVGVLWDSVSQLADQLDAAVTLLNEIAVAHPDLPELPGRPQPRPAGNGQ